MSKARSSWYIATLLATAGAASLGGCSADPESDALGSCTLNCAGPKVGSQDYVIEPFGATSSVQCGADPQKRQFYPFNGPVRVQFRIYKNEKSFGPWPKPSGLVDVSDVQGAEGADSGQFLQDDGGGGGGGGGDDSAKTGEPPILDRIPRQGIGFEPLLSGLMSVENTNDEFKTDDTTASTFKFAGVVTPTSEWCSDSCGVITYEFWPLCQAGGTNGVEASILVHGATPPSPISIGVVGSN